VAQNYVMLCGFQHELRVVRDNVAAQQATLKLQQIKLQAGLTNRLTISQVTSLVASTESQIPTLETEIEQTFQRLAVLLDRDPQAIKAQLSDNGTLPTGPASVPPGLPSELLRRRPDVRQAEHQFAAATAEIGVAMADLFPKFSLTGSLGLESLQLKTFANTSSIFYSFGPSIQWRIFDAGQIWANVHVQNARQEQTLIQYRQAVIQSMADVESALTAYNREQARSASLRQAVEANRQSVALARQLNEAGVVDFLNVLTAQQSLYQSEDQLAQSEQTVLTNLIALYKALGGGWETTERAADAQPRETDDSK
jgi:outer membrane protein, multidrug efflux system